MLYSSHCLLLSSSLFLLGASAAQDAGAHSAIQPHHDHDAVVDMSPDVHSHTSHSSHHSEPLVQLNETEILRWNGPDPLSYWAHDFEAIDDNLDSKNWRGLMGLHVVGMTLAFFVLLPAAISLRSVRHRWHAVALVAFNLVAFFSSAAGTLYKKLTGNLYNGAVHGTGGFIVLALAAVLAAFDALYFFQRAFVFFRSPDRRNYRLFWRSVILNQSNDSSHEYTHLIPDDADEFVTPSLHRHSGEKEQVHRAHFIDTIDSPISESGEWVQSASSQRSFVNHPIHDRRHSMASSHSEDTLHTPPSQDSHDIHESRQRRWTTLARIGHAAFATAERTLVVLAFIQLLSGIVVYTGICRGSYVNGCMAHLIKGGIFWCYGLLTFGRYLGAWADLGWAWNRLPARRLNSHKIPSAEAVESFVIFFYGITNVWMERFGVHPGDPFTTRQIQHISIAAMFWFAGMLGLVLESGTFRRWLSSPAQSVVRHDEQITPPPSYAGSFNPFPALVIGVTGAAMSAHHQRYLFQVEIHALWGFFLTGFAVFRCLTYFFLWLRPPHSVLPSRPPTEAVASFFLAAGGLVFIFSTEQITFAAMRRQMDDMMFIFNVAITMTCVAFCWVVSITAFKGWLAYRTRTSSPSPTPYKVLFDEHEA